MHEWVYIFTCMCAEFTCLGIHIYMYGHRVCLCSCICLHICTPCLPVVYVCTYMQTEFATIYIYVWKDTVCPRAVCVYKYRHTCLCLYLVYGCVLNVCVDIHVYVYAHRGCGCMYTIYMYCIGVCTCVRIHTEFSCVIFSMFTYLCYRPVEV